MALAFLITVSLFCASNAATINSVSPCRGADCSRTEVQLANCDHVVCPPLSRPGCPVELSFPESPDCGCLVCQQECPDPETYCVPPGPNCQNTITTHPHGDTCPPCQTCIDQAAVVNTTPTKPPCEEINCPEIRNCKRRIPALINSRGCRLTCPRCARRWGRSFKRSNNFIRRL